MPTELRPKTLTNPPLLEVIFEMSWEIPQVPNMPVRRDPAYPLVYGRMYDRFKQEYGVVEDLPSVQAHPDSTPYVVRHRLRKEANAWPLMQIGPGILTVNAGKEYSWDIFRSEIVRVFEAFCDFYPASTFPLNIVKTELRYLNRIAVEENENLLSVLANQLHTHIHLDPQLFSSQVSSNPQGLTMNMGFPVVDPAGHAILSISTGEVDGKPALVQQTLTQSIGEAAPKDLGVLDPWLDSMHGIAKNWFETLYRGELMRQFT